MWPFSPGDLGDSFSVLALRWRLGLFGDDLALRLGSDGKLVLAHPDAPDDVIATIELAEHGPAIEQHRSFPGLLQRGLEGWDEWEETVGEFDLHPRIGDGPLLLTSIEPGQQIDIYTNAELPWEPGVTPARSLTEHDLRDGWFIDWMQFFCARTAVRVTGRRPPHDV